MKPFDRFKIVVALAFASAISFIQCFQYVAEKTGVGLWIGIGTIFLAGALQQLMKAVKDSNKLK